MVKSLFGLQDRHNIPAISTRYREGSLTVADFFNLLLITRYGSSLSIIDIPGELLHYAQRRRWNSSLRSLALSGL